MVPCKENAFYVVVVFIQELEKFNLQAVLGERVFVVVIYKAVPFLSRSR